MKQITIGALIIGISFATPALAQLNSQPILQKLPDGNFTLCSIPDLPTSPTREQYLIDSNAICFWFSKQGDKVAGLLATSGSLGRDAICIEGKVSNNMVTGTATGIPNTELYPTGYDVNLLGNFMVSYWLSQQPRVLQLSQGTYKTDRQYPYVFFPKARLTLEGFYRYNVGNRLPPKTCQIK